MHKDLFILIIFTLVSCQDFDTKKTDAKSIYQEELKAFNWNEVDVYPTFSSCENSQTKAEKKGCFETTLAQHILNNIQTETIIVSKNINDTLVLAFQISEKGTIDLKNIIITDFIKEQIPSIETVLAESINKLPKIFPAIKRNQPVKTEFKLPIIIKAK